MTVWHISRHIRHAFVTLAIAGTVAVALAPPARAQTTATPPGGMSATRCQDSVSGGSGIGGGGAAGGGAGGGGGGSWGAPGPQNPTSELDRDAKENEEHGLCATLLEAFAPGEDPGQFPSSHYDIGYDAGGTLSFWRKFYGLSTDFVFGADTWFVRVGLGIVEWVWNFDLANALRPQAEAIGEAYQTKIVGPMNLAHGFLLITALYASWLALSGKIGRGIGEIGVSLLIGALAAVAWTHPAETLTGALRFSTQLGNEITAATLGVDTSGGASTVMPMERAVHKALVDQPHEWLNWGRAIPPGDPCRAVYEAAVASGPWGAADEPRDAMAAAGCKAEAAYNHDPSRDRMVGAILLSFGGAVVMVLVVLLGLVLLGCQIGILGLIVTAHLAMVCGTLPGRMRALFWRWCGGAAVLLCVMLVMYVVLALTLAAISAVLSMPTGIGIIKQMLVIDVIAVYALYKQGSIRKGARHAATGFAQRMASAQVGGQSMRRQQVSWNSRGGAAAIGAAGGFALARAKGAHRAWDGHKRRSYQRDTRAFQQESRDLQRARYGGGGGEGGPGGGGRGPDRPDRGPSGGDGGGRPGGGGAPDVDEALDTPADDGRRGYDAEGWRRAEAGARSTARAHEEGRRRALDEALA